MENHLENSTLYYVQSSDTTQKLLLIQKFKENLDFMLKYQFPTFVPLGLHYVLVGHLIL